LAIFLVVWPVMVPNSIALLACPKRLSAGAPGTMLLRVYLGGIVMKKVMMAIVLLGLAPFAAMAQTTAVEANPVSNMLRQILERSAKNIPAAADEMPADKYSYSPTPDQMTFGHLVLHITNFNNLMCSKISGTTAPEAPKLADTDPKDKLVPALKSSFDYCTQALAKVDDSNLGESLTVFGDRKMSKAGAMMIYASSFSDHYGAAAMYLRLNKLIPPTAAPKPAEK
jgi:DinB superfamily